jgi:hypothetical protein
MHIEPRSATDATILKVLIRRERNAKQRDRYRVVLLALSGRTAPQPALRTTVGLPLSRRRAGEPDGTTPLGQTAQTPTHG